MGGRAEQSVLRWLGHMERMEEDRSVKSIIGVRLGGRPRTGWMDGVKIALTWKRNVCGARKDDCA